MSVRCLQPNDFHDWARMRRILWPHVTLGECRKEWETVRRKPSQFAIFVSESADGLQGFLEASLRRDYTHGCSTTPVGYIEGWYVAGEARRQRIGRKLVRAAEQWARTRGCKEMGSDTELSNKLSQKTHRALGYTECGRCIHFRKALC